VLAITPHPKRTPLWARLSRLTFTHIVLVMGGWVWSQGWRGKGVCKPLEQWLQEAGEAREFVEVGLIFSDHDPVALSDALDRSAGRRTQRLRACLRFLRLWPRPVWQCTSPVREVLAALDHPVEGETPDAIIEDLG
jgi:hypothetical protein